MAEKFLHLILFNASVLTATLWLWTRGCLFYVIFVLSHRQHLIYHTSGIGVGLNDQMINLTVNVLRNINIPRVQNRKVAVGTHAFTMSND